MKYFSLYAHNVPVKGRHRSAIYDLAKNRIISIPNPLFNAFIENRHIPLKTFHDEKDKIRGCIDYLLKNEYGLYVDSIKKFPPLNLEYEDPFKVYSSIIEFKDLNIFYNAIEQLDKLNCKYLEIRFLQKNDLRLLKAALNYLVGKSFNRISIYMPFTKEINIKELITERYPQIKDVIFYSSPYSGHKRNIFYSDKTGKELFEDGRIKHVVNIKYFTEAQSYNTYYNRKVCIDGRGEIKNSLLFENSFGNIKYDKIENIIDNKDFRKLWNASPDKIIDVRDSELRYCMFIPFKLKPLGDLFKIEN